MLCLSFFVWTIDVPGFSFAALWWCHWIHYICRRCRWGWCGSFCGNGHGFLSVTTTTIDVFHCPKLVKEYGQFVSLLSFNVCAAMQKRGHLYLFEKCRLSHQIVKSTRLKLQILSTHYKGFGTRSRNGMKRRSSRCKCWSTVLPEEREAKRGDRGFILSSAEGGSANPENLSTSHETNLSTEWSFYMIFDFWILLHRNGSGTRPYCPRAHNSFVTKNISSLLDLMIESLRPREFWIADDTNPTPPAYDDSLALPWFLKNQAQAIAKIATAVTYKQLIPNGKSNMPGGA